MELEVKRDPGILKFIKLMRNLTQLINEEPNHQQTIYECLNSHEIKSLFDSIHDEDPELRMTAIRFVCLLLHNNARIIELIGVLEGYEQVKGCRKYLLGGLEYYQLPLAELRPRSSHEHGQNKIPAWGLGLGYRCENIQNKLFAGRKATPGAIPL